MPRHRSYHVVFRADASGNIGTGHIMRCLTLANALKSQGLECSFVCRPQLGDLIDLVKQSGYQVAELPQIISDQQPAEQQIAHEHWLKTDWLTDAMQTQAALNKPVDFLIVDHYALDARWEISMRQSINKIMVIDDLADRSHDCDLLLDQNLGSTCQSYETLVPAHTKLLVGAEYALLRPEFAAIRSHSLRRRRATKPSRIMVSMGGVDKDNITSRVLTILDELETERDLEILTIMGPKAPWLRDIVSQARVSRHPTTVLSNVKNMATLMAEADIAIGAAGSTSWERCALGLPTILVILAENQREVGRRLAASGAAELIDLDDNFGSHMAASLRLLLDNDAARSAMSDGASAICDGSGVFKVARAVLSLLRLDGEEVV